MAYTINKTDGTKLVALRDGTVDIATTDLALFGKGYAGFGERLNENFVKVLENFANTTAPANKIKGQLQNPQNSKFSQNHLDPLAYHTRPVSKKLYYLLIFSI